MQERNKDVYFKRTYKGIVEESANKNRRNKHKKKRKMPVGEIEKQREAEKHEGIKQTKRSFHFTEGERDINTEKKRERVSFVESKQK